MEVIMQQLIFNKTLPQTAIDERLCLPTDSLPMLPPFVGGSTVQNLIVNDMEEEGIVWNLRFSIRSEGHPKPVFGGDWVHFVEKKGLQVGDEIYFFRVIDANGGATYHMRPFRNFL